MKTAAVILVAGLAAVVAQARVITVDDDGPADFNNIQAAIDDANETDEIVVSQGLYRENIHFLGKNIVLTSRDPSEPDIVAGTVIHGNHLAPVVTFLGTETSECRLEGLTITGGHASGCWESGGGGIRGNGTNATISDCVIVDNMADCMGGGVSYCDGVIERCVIRGNTGGYGGGLSVCRGVIVGCRVSGNVGLFGSAAYLCGTWINCVVTGNSPPPRERRDIGTILASGVEPLLIRNCTITGNRSFGIATDQGGHVIVENTILWANTADDIGMRDIELHCGSRHQGSADVTFSLHEYDWTGYGCVAGSDNVIADPCFAMPGYWDPNGTPEDICDDFWVDGDYHLKSQAGRWDAGAGAWVYDDVTSVGIDFGDPLAPVGLESFPNGGRINAGAYGGTAEASRSWFGGPVCETIMAGDINGDCKVDFRDFWFVALNWLRDGQ